MKAIIEGVAILVIALFGLFGALVFGAILHEYSHSYDFKDIAENEKICGFVLPNKINKVFSELGYYSFSMNNTEQNTEKLEKIGKYTEFKAYVITFLVLLVFVVSLEITFRGILSGLKVGKGDCLKKIEILR
jgi:hypothetical protein